MYVNIEQNVSNDLRASRTDICDNKCSMYCLQLYLMNMIILSFCVYGICYIYRITCESETDRDENDSDVMNLRSKLTERMQQCEIMNFRLVNSIHHRVLMYR